MIKVKVLSALDAVKLIPDGATVGAPFGGVCRVP